MGLGAVADVSVAMWVIEPGPYIVGRNLLPLGLLDPNLYMHELFASILKKETACTPETPILLTFILCRGLLSN